MQCLIAIVGPTAVGKSELALYLSQYFPTEIVGADSRQVYRYMDIGTNKPTLAERAMTPHHLIGIIAPDEDFNLAMYQKLASGAINTIQQKNKIPLLVGGSGLYIWSLIEGWRMPQVAPNPKLRHDLERRAKKEGSNILYKELQQIDPLAVIKILPSNTRRIIRALEIYHVTGQPPSQLQIKKTPDFPILSIGLTLERTMLYDRIDCRLHKMVQDGLIKEVDNLLKRGYSSTLPAMTSIGYKQIIQFIQGKLSLPLAMEQIKHQTHRLVRHQYTWFKPGDRRIHWFNPTEDSNRGKMIELVRNFLT
ncbi:MAG: tRNA (adenosine(37)-N6)-dimethylallyltransferase MiaA [Dehalococcoidia bacterium]|nr:tRNA (adenosine(37)-N6)-dimethylallyltransferase MiaA [Dehalococcoidia bacterium]